MHLTRRRLIETLAIGGGLLVQAACRATAATPRPTIPASTLTPEFGTWAQEANGMLTDALSTLRTYDVYQAFRVGAAADSGRRGASELAWDPPVRQAWEEATHVTGGLRNRAEQLFNAVTTTSARADSSLWREHRALADSVNELVSLGERIAAYRARLDVLPPGDASGALDLLDRAWGQWDVAAARWGLARGELITCAA